MNFSSFVTPFSISTTINNQFPAKFNSNTEVNNADTNSEINGLISDNSSVLKFNTAESMMMAVSRYQNSNHRINHQQNLLNKYYRDNCVQISEEVPNNSINSSSTSSTLSLITTKLRPNDNLSGIHYGSLRCNLSQLAKYDLQTKRPIQNDGIRTQNICNVIKKEERESNENGTDISSLIPLQSSQPSTNISVTNWQSIAAVAAAVAAAPPLATPTTTVADYLSHLSTSTLPISLHSFLKYSTENVKKDIEALDNVICVSQVQKLQNQEGSIFINGQQSANRKKKRKKQPKEKKMKPKPGEIRITTALDGSALYCCPECHMAYPDKSLLEQHLLGHTIERRFFCDICGAGLKRKDHLTRHKQSHNPDRPHACSVCTKAFKRKEQLALHYVIHSGEKRHVCPECGKGFYRKDHLRKHTRSHIARRVKAELSQYVPSVGNSAYSSAS